jgi:acyl dehydratase
MDEAVRYSQVNVGDALPPLVMPPVSRLTLALYCGASGDHNPLHVDQDFAREAGLGDVIAHGMLIMAYMGRTLTNWVPQTAIQTFGTRFQAMTRVGDEITCTARITDKLADELADVRAVRVVVEARDQRGELKAAGDALIALPA